MCIHVQKRRKKKVAIYSRLSPASGESRLSMVIVKKKKYKKMCLSVDLLNDYMRFFTGLYCVIFRTAKIY